MRLVMNPGNNYMIYGKMIRAGDEFEVPANEGETWVRLGRASPKGEVVDRGESAVSPASEGESSQRVKGPRSKRYNRSDMRAEDD